MRNDLNDILAAQPTQHSLDWFRARLGKFTGSEVGRLMKAGKGKDEYFGKDALSYTNEVVAERLLNPSVVMLDELFEEYLMQVTASSKAMAWGNDQEMNARTLYSKVTGRKVTSCGAVELSEWFASSPDGVCLDDNGCIEIKCPTSKVHTEYLLNVQTAEELKAVRPLYYWQCIAHMAVTGADWCDWVSYCPFSQKPLHIVRIAHDAEAEGELLHRIECARLMAQAMIEEITKTSGRVIVN